MKLNSFSCLQALFVVPLCVPTPGSSRPLPALGLHPLHPPQWKQAPLLWGLWQGLNAGRAVARPGTEQGMQLKALWLPGSAQLREPLRPMGNAQGSFPIQVPTSHPSLLVCVLVTQWLHSAEGAQPAGRWSPRWQQRCWELVTLHGSCGAGNWVLLSPKAE